MTDTDPRQPLGHLETATAGVISQDLPPWRGPLARALHRNRAQPHARYFQLATVRPNGTPANRTVVFRGFVEQANGQGSEHSLKLVSDRRSAKFSQITSTPEAEICWYFTKTREQFRLAGRLVCIDHRHPHQALRQSSWQALSASAQAQFGWPQPGAARSPDAAFTAVSPDTPPESFAVLLLAPVWVDHLELRGDPQARTRYQWQPESLSWQVQPVNP